jgi:6-phosphofructokinase
VKPRRRIAILTGGGDTPPLNAVIFSLRRLLDDGRYDYIGYLDGWDGVLGRKTVDLRTLPDYGSVGGTVLRSSRVNLAQGDGFESANRNLQEAGIDALVVIGGDDTLSNVYGITAAPCLAVSKTIDNDVGSFRSGPEGLSILNYFTLGYPSAANKIARFVSLEQGLRTTAYSHRRIMVVETMGMQAGWLALASAFGNPDFIVIPEFPLEYSEFLDRLKRRYTARGHAIVVIAEGSRFSDGGFMRENTAERDAFGNPRLGGASAALTGRLKESLKGFMDARNVNAVNPSYLYRSGAPDPLDAEAARLAAEVCAGAIGADGPAEHRFVHITRDGGRFGAASCAFSDFEKTDRGRFPKRTVDPALYDSASGTAGRAWEEYLAPIVSFRSTETAYPAFGGS